MVGAYGVNSELQVAFEQIGARTRKEITRTAMGEVGSNPTALANDLNERIWTRTRCTEYTRPRGSRGTRTLIV